VLGADFVGGEEAQERRAACGGFDGGRPLASSRSTMQTTAATIMPASLRGFDGVDGGGAGGADVVDDDHAGAFAAEAFDAAAGAVGFFGFADEEAVEQRRVGMR
jgi:hypothetical protein